jgi:hypothetical protein
VAEGEAMTIIQRQTYLLDRGWDFTYNPTLEYDEPAKLWVYHLDGSPHTFLGAFMRQQAADARAEREAEGRP